MRLGDSIFERVKLKHLMNVVPKKHFFNWSFYVSTLIAIIYYIYTYGNIAAQKHFISFMNENSMQYFSVGISAISMILAAFAITVVVYSKKDLHLIALHDKRTFEGFIFPYIWGAIVWAILAVVSIMSNIVPINMGLTISYIVYTCWLFLVLYASMFTVYIIQELLQHVLLSATIEDGE